MNDFASDGGERSEQWRCVNPESTSSHGSVVHRLPTPPPSLYQKVVLVVNSDAESSSEFRAAKQLADVLWQYGGPGTMHPPLVHSVWINLHSEAGNAVLGGGGWRRVHGEEEAWQRFGETQVCLGPGGRLLV